MFSLWTESRSLSRSKWVFKADVEANAEKLTCFIHQGHQVAPAELEAILLSHPLVADVAVIPISDEDAGEVPKAFVVRTDTSTPISDKQLQADLYQHIASQSARYKWLDGGVEFIDEIPKSPAGKILRRLLRGLEAERATQKTTAKL